MKLDEDTIKQGLLDLVQTILNVSQILLDLSPDRPNDIQRVIEYEIQADQIVEQVDKAIEAVKVAPTLQIDRTRLLHRLDSILDAQERLARNYQLYSPFLDDTNRPFLRELAQINFTAAQMLHQALTKLFTNFSEALENVRQVTALRDESRPLLYNERAKLLATTNDWKRYHALDTLVKRYRDITDRIKDATAVIGYIVIKYTQ